MERLSNAADATLVGRFACTAVSAVKGGRNEVHSETTELQFDCCEITGVSELVADDGV